MSKIAREIEELSAACIAQPGIGALLKATIAAMRQPGAAPDLDLLFGVLDPARYSDEDLVADAARFLEDKGRPDLAHRWLRQALMLKGGAAESVAPDAPQNTNSPWGPVVSLDRFRNAGSAHQHQPPQQPPELPPRLREPVGLDDVAGLSHVKDQIRRRIIQPFAAEGLYARFRRKAGGGVLMYGPPGCGKTMLARATAHECKATFMPVEISEILSRYVGDSEKRMKQIFENARRRAPSILFFDEVEALARKRGNSDNVDAMVSVFLNEFDGLAQSNEGVLVLAATNVPWSVDPAFRRPGRFDRTLFVPPPDREARAAILHKLLAPLPHMPGLDVRPVAEATSGYSGADLAELMATASDHAIDDSLRAGGVQPIGLKHMQAALAESRPTTLEWLTTARSYAEYANRDGAWDDLAEFIRKHS